MNRASPYPEVHESLRHAAFAEWVVPEIPVLLRVAISLSDQASDTEDLVQDTLIRAYRAVDRFDGRHPQAWLLTILRNTHLNRMRRRMGTVMSRLHRARTRLRTELTARGLAPGGHLR